MRVVVGWKSPDRNAASTSEMSRFETELLAQKENLKGLSLLNTGWVKRAMGHTVHERVILDIDSSESPVHGKQEEAAYNGHFECVCYHPLFCFNQFGDCEGAVLRPGNVHSANEWAVAVAWTKCARDHQTVAWESRSRQWMVASEHGSSH